MSTWTITPPDAALSAAIRHRIDTKTKPLGALGQLEALAHQIALVQQTLTPALHRPHVLVFAADHGIAQAGVSQYPPEVTHQMVRNFVGGGAAINVFCRQHGLGLTIVDAGVRGSFADLPAVRDEKMAEGTRNFRHEPAMSAAQCADALRRGARLTDELHASGCNVLGMGEMGIGNTSAAAVATFEEVIEELRTVREMLALRDAEHFDCAETVAAVVRVWESEPDRIAISAAVDPLLGLATPGYFGRRIQEIAVTTSIPIVQQACLAIYVKPEAPVDEFGVLMRIGGALRRIFRHGETVARLDRNTIVVVGLDATQLEKCVARVDSLLAQPWACGIVVGVQQTSVGAVLAGHPSARGGMKA